MQWAVASAVGLVSSTAGTLTRLVEMHRLLIERTIYHRTHLTGVSHLRLKVMEKQWAPVQWACSLREIFLTLSYCCLLPLLPVCLHGVLQWRNGWGRGGQVRQLRGPRRDVCQTGLVRRTRVYHKARTCTDFGHDQGHALWTRWCPVSLSVRLSLHSVVSM